LTSIHYLFKKTLGIAIPIDYIGNMPRRLFALSEWRVLWISIDNVRSGDLIFVKNREKPKLLSHAALFLNVDRIFHCYARGGAVIQKSEDFFSLYSQELNFKEMMRYIDIRNKELREKQGTFIIENC
jgi:hypothetical protein